MSSNETIHALLAAAVSSVRARRPLPESTYRLQFHAGFTFRDAEAIIPYLHDLGITDCYSSPYLRARPGSTHGYDITDHGTLNPEIGDPTDYDAFVTALASRSMGQILDVVPNHMGIASNDNAWWNDVLENGPSSAYAGFFDIDWRPVKPQLRDKVLLPVLGDVYGKVLESRQLVLGYEAGTFAVAYFDRRFPIAPDTYDRVLGYRLHDLSRRLEANSAPFMEYGSILTATRNLPDRSDPEPVKMMERQREKEVIKRRLAALTDSCAAVREFVAENVDAFNGRPGDPHSLDLLDDLLNAQSYRLSFWRVAADEINYRRFFDVNELAALSMEKPEVFAATHELILRLVAEGKVTGLRIDHPDGLYDPRQYLDRLQERVILDEARRLFAGNARFHEAGRLGPTAEDEWGGLEQPLREEIRTRRTRPGAGTPLRQPLYLVVEKFWPGKSASPKIGPWTAPPATSL